MRDLITVAKFTAKEMLKRKSFIISNLIIMLIIIIGFNVPNIMNLINGEDIDDTFDYDKVLILDSEKIFGENLQALNQMQLGMNFEFIYESLDKETIKQKIESEEISEAIIITNDNENVKLEYIVDSLGMSGSSESVAQIFNELYKNVKLGNSGLSVEQIAKINEPIILEVTELKEGSSGAMLFIAMMLCLVLFYAIYFCAYQVSSSITIEKTSKIMETLVTSTTPKTIVLGKTIGIGVVGLLQILVLALTALVSYKLFLPEGILDGIFDVSKITPKFAIITFIYFILGYTLYALMYALTGSTVSKPEDIQSANGPVAMIAVIGFYLAYFSMMNPTSDINTFASILPISAPFSMPFRIIGSTATNGEIAISLVIMLVTIAIVAQVAIKIYSSAIFHYGTKLSLKDLVKMYKDKNN